MGKRLVKATSGTLRKTILVLAACTLATVAGARKASSQCTLIPGLGNTITCVWPGIPCQTFNWCVYMTCDATPCGMGVNGGSQCNMMGCTYAYCVPCS